MDGVLLSPDEIAPLSDAEFADWEDRARRAFVRRSLHLWMLPGRDHRDVDAGAYLLAHFADDPILVPGAYSMTFRHLVDGLEQLLDEVS